MPNLLQTLRDTYLTNPAAALNMIPEICKAIDEGLIIEMPCKIGSTVYWRSHFGTGVNQGEIIGIKISKFGIDLEICEQSGNTFKREFEKICLTREAAEEKLEGEKK